MYEKKEFKQLPKNVLDFGKLGLYSDKLDGAEYRPQFTIKVMRGFIYAMVRTGSPTDVKNGFMSLKLDPKNYYAFMTLFKELLDKTRDTFRLSIEERVYDEKTSQFSAELVSKGALKMSRDDKDKIFISLVIDERPLIQFYFGREYNCTLKKEGGNELTEAEYSQLYAQSYYMMLNDLVPKVLASNPQIIFDSPFVEKSKTKSSPPPKTENSKFDDFDDDIPF